MAFDCRCSIYDFRVKNYSGNKKNRFALIILKRANLIRFKKVVDKIPKIASYLCKLNFCCLLVS